MGIKGLCKRNRLCCPNLPLRSTTPENISCVKKIWLYNAINVFIFLRLPGHKHFIIVFFSIKLIQVIFLII